MNQVRATTSQGKRRGHSLFFVGGGVALVAAAIAFTSWIKGGESVAGSAKADTFTVKRGSFDVLLPATGELVALKQVEIRNQLTTRAVITQIIEEGKWANVGDVLVKFNDEELSVQLNQVTDEVNLADAAVVAAAAELDVREKEGESDLSKAKLAVYLADLALKAWEEGEFKSKTQRLKMAVESAEKNFLRLKDRYVTSEKLKESGFLSMDEYRNDEISLIDARSKYDQSVTDLDIYQRFESLQERAKKESDVEQAKGELERTQKRVEARVRSAQRELESKKHQLQSRKDRKKQLETQIGFCKITAPSSGLVVYASSMESSRWGGGWNQGPPHVGMEMFPNQSVIMLPDTSQMVAEVKVNESLSSQVKVGQRATVTADALSNVSLTGDVISIGVLAEAGGWRDPNRRDYTVRIALGPNEQQLKPCMRCKTEIKVDRVDNAVYVPVQAVFHSGNVAYVWSPSGAGYSQKKITAGRSSELFTEILEGLSEGERVLLRDPKPEEVVSRLPGLEEKKPQADDASETPATPANPSPVNPAPAAVTSTDPAASTAATSPEPSTASAATTTAAASDAAPAASTSPAVGHATEEKSTPTTSPAAPTATIEAAPAPSGG